jgi:tRNA(Ile)-lysidine synthase
MLDTLKHILQEECRLQINQPIVAGVSGGPDSLCLLTLLHEGGYQVIAAHFNHRLRPEADHDAAAVESIAVRLGIRFVGAAGEVRQHAAEKKLSIEAAARDLRYHFLFEQAHLYGTQAVAVGHTADDQAETVLMHFIRGAGLNGLKGMPYRTYLPEYDVEIPLIRPLLDVWRVQTVAWCEARRLQPLYDASNDSLDLLRNRLRHELIPTLETYNPRFRQAVWRSGKTLSSDHDLLGEILEPLWQQAMQSQTDDYIALDLTFLRMQSTAVQMHMLRRAVQTLLPDHDIDYSDLQRAAAFVADQVHDRTDFTGGLMLLREEQKLYIASAESQLPSAGWPQMPDGVSSLFFSPPAKLDLAANWEFSAVRSHAARPAVPDTWTGTDPFTALLDAQDLPEKLELRVRKPGDRFEPLGMHGHSQKLSDIFVNLKLPSRARERWPLLCSREQIIWVPGFRPAHSHRLRPESSDVLCVTISHRTT